MSEYKLAILRNALLAAIGISLVVSLAVFGSTIVTQIHSPSGHTPSSLATGESSKSGSVSESATQSSSSTATKTSNSDRTTTTTTSSSPTTVFPPKFTVAEIPYSAIAFTYDNYSKTIFATSNGSSSTILEINATTNNVAGQISIPGGSRVTSMIFDPDNKELYVALSSGIFQSSSKNKSIIAILTSNDTIMWNNTATGIAQLALDPAHDLVYGSGFSHSELGGVVNVSVINGSTNTIVKNITLFETGPNSQDGCCYLGPLIYNPVTAFLYESIGVYGPDGGFAPSLLIFDTATNSTFNSSSALHGIFDFSYSPSSGYTFLADNGFTSPIGAQHLPFVRPGGNITILDGSTYISTLELGRPGQNESAGSIVYDPYDQSLLVANGTLNLQNYRFVDQNVTIIDTATGIISKVLSMQTGGINALFFDPANSDLYVASPDMIYVVSVSH
jgi:DNA-binding beta-propeller fold protein YncE